MAAGAFLAHAALHGAGQIFRPIIASAETVGNNLLPMERPSIEQIMDLYRRKWLSFGNAQAALKNAGCAMDLESAESWTPQGEPLGLLGELWAATFMREQELPTLQESIEVANRHLWEDPQLVSWLPRLGYYDKEVKDVVANLRYDIPGPSDLVRFSIRHVWEPELMAELGYNAEFPGQVIDLWHAMKGLDYKIFTGPFKDQVDKIYNQKGAGYDLALRYQKTVGDEPTWAKAYWWSHWVLPSPSMGYEAYFRLRPDRDPKWDPPEARGVNFDLNSLYLLLRANDYPPRYRPVLASIAYRIPGVRFIRSMRATNVYTYQDVFEWARRSGYSERDSLDIANNIEVSVQQAAGKAKACKGCAQATKAFEVGLLSEAELTQQYQAFGVAPDEAARLTGLAKLDLATKRAAQVVSSVRKRVLSGAISFDEARQALLDYGIVAERTAEYIDDWTLEFTEARKELGAGKAVQYACKGIISLDDLRTRLTNLGYDVADQEALVAEAEYCTLQLLAQAAAKADRAARQKKADLLRAQRLARQQLLEAQQALAKHGSPNQLRKWFCEGSIGQPEVTSRLNFLGWPEIDICRFLSDCTKKESGGGPIRKPAAPCPAGPPTG